MLYFYLEYKVIFFYFNKYSSICGVKCEGAYFVTAFWVNVVWFVLLDVTVFRFTVRMSYVIFVGISIAVFFVRIKGD